MWMLDGDGSYHIYLYISTVYMCVRVCVCGIGVSCSSDSASYHVTIIFRTVISNRFKAPGRDDSAQLLMVYEEVYVSKDKTLIC